MNEDERGVTPADVTSMTIDRIGREWRVIIEQGNGDVVKMIKLTELERMQLGMMLDWCANTPSHVPHISFVDITR